jgi:hypothetical protein
MNMKDMIQKMTDIETEETSKKQKLNEGAAVTMAADNAQEVGALMAMMRNAGMDPKPVAADMPMPMRTDIDKFRAAVNDNPDIPGRDDVPGDQDLQAGLMKGVTSGGGTALGNMIAPGIGGPLGALAGGGGLAGAAGSVLGGMAGGPIGAALGGAIGGALNDSPTDDPNIPGKDDVPGDQDLKQGMMGGLLGSLAGGAAGQVLGKGLGDTLGKTIGGAMGGMGDTAGKIGTAIGKALPGVGGAAVGGMLGDKLTGTDEATGDYANSPDEQYSPASDVINPPTNDLNKSKGSYPKVAGGDNPMALSDKIKEDLLNLYQEYK